MAYKADSGSTAVKPTMKKLMYKSPLSAIRSAPYKPPVDNSDFKPIVVSSPKLEDLKEDFKGLEGDRFALKVEGQQGKRRPPNLETQRTPNLGVDSKQSPIIVDSSVIPLSLVGRGGHWRGPQENDMSPETRRGGKRHSYNSSLASEGIGQWYSPVQNVNDSRNDSFRRKSFRHNNFMNNSSFGSNPHTPNSLRQFYSSDTSYYSARNNRRGGGKRGGNQGHRATGDISLYYSPLMLLDPWLDLMRAKMNASNFQSKSVDRNSGSIVTMNLTGDSDMDDRI